MKKVLLGTTALVAASLMAGAAAQADDMMAEPISASVGGHFFAALGMLSGDSGAGEPLANMHSTAMAQDVQISISGSTMLDNGMSVSVTALIDSDHGDTGGLALDERYITLGGSFGSLQIGSVESASQQKHTWAPSATGSFGINSPYFTFTPAGGWLGRYNDGIGNEDSLKLVYFTPTVNGFSLGLSYAPDDSGGGQYGGATSGDAGKYKNHIGIGASYSQEFAGGNLSLSVGHETYDAEVPSGMSCATIVGASDMVRHRSMYTLAQKVKIITNAFDADNDGSLGDTLMMDGEGEDIPGSSELLMAIDKAQELWTGDENSVNPLLTLDVDGAPTGLTSDTVLDGKGGSEQYSFYTGMSTAANPGAPLSTNCNPETTQFGLSFSFGEFSFGGGWRETDSSATTKTSVMDFGVGWSDGGPMSLAAMWGQVEEEATGGGAETTRYGVNGGYALGPGVALEAQLDFGEYDAAGPTDPTMDFDWTQFMIGTAITF